MNKIFIIGLPRTGTTSICVALLAHDFKVAHTALTKQAFALADVIADTPCFADYVQLDRLFPNSVFIYSERKLDQWIPSIQMLLNKTINYTANGQHLNPVIIRCFEQIFAFKSHDDPLDKAHLMKCYLSHQQAVLNHFKAKENFLPLDVNNENSLASLLRFLNKDNKNCSTFPHLNTGKMITAWKDIKHPNKVDSNAAGPERRKFLDYS